MCAPLQFTNTILCIDVLEFLLWVVHIHRWLDESEGDGLIERELAVTRVIDGEDLAAEWKVRITTGNKDNSSTDAKVNKHYAFSI